MPEKAVTLRGSKNVTLSICSMMTSFTPEVYMYLVTIYYMLWVWYIGTDGRPPPVWVGPRTEIGRVCEGAILNNGEVSSI